MEPTLAATIQLFDEAIRQVESRLAGAGLKIDLSVAAPSRYSSEKRNTISLTATFWDGTNSQHFTAPNLDALVSEVFRRCGFAERTREAVDHLSTALLPAPDDC